MNPKDDLRLRANTLGLTELADNVILNHGFCEWSGSASANRHHYGKGGLVRHIN